MIQDTLDKTLHSLPIAGTWFQRTYAYFRNHTALTNLMHVAAGLGIGFLIAGEDLTMLGVLLFALSVAGHMYAFIKAK